MSSVLITGTSKGIGFETALVMARAGHTVYATTRNPSASTRLQEIAERESLPITVSAMDVDSDTSVRDAFENIHASGVNIDVLVNNAGIERNGSIEELSFEDFRAVMETNYFGVIRCIKAVLPRMRERKNGCIINVASVAGHIANSPLSSYAASKHALEALSECLGQEMRPFNVRVAIIEPGIIDTAMAQRLGEETNSSHYPQVARFSDLFTASLKNPVEPSLVGQKILEVADSDDWTLRHPVGPDAIPFLEWRESMSDDQWMEWGALSNEEWYPRVQADFGIDARKAPTVVD
jgi:NAD(P)-dependent dehydrogenase (short-subunit alcohol dehydrogenase family)